MTGILQRSTRSPTCWCCHRAYVLLAYDDEAGERAAAYWLDALLGASRLVPEDDPARMLEAGARESLSLSDWRIWPFAWAVM